MTGLGFSLGRNRFTGKCSGSNHTGCNSVFEFVSYYDMEYPYTMQCQELYHAVVANLQPNQYALSRYKITLKITLNSWVINSKSTNIAPIHNRRPAGERPPKTAQFAYRSCCYTMRSRKLDWSKKAGLASAGFPCGNQPKSNRLRLSCAKTHCSSLVPVRTLTRAIPAGWDHC